MTPHFDAVQGWHDVGPRYLRRAHFPVRRPPGTLDDLSPWLDAFFEPVADVVARLDSLENRRYLKTHLPLDAIPYQPSTKYIYVGRDGRDVWMSMWNHWNNITPDVIAMFTTLPPASGRSCPYPRMTSTKPLTNG